ncbi:Trm112 family protein [Thorsellia kenyensis]|uniref:Trm112 family protein n=1 Tax=Thorsellia kenyensis TaxID=1549888 RepID=A0ABV6CD10_9GAMM
MNLHKTLCEIATCPICHTQLHLDKENEQFICDKDKKIYPIREGIAVLLTEEAKDF